MECHVSAKAGNFALDVNIQVPAHDGWLGIAGPSGAGKSTFLQALAGFNPSASVAGNWGDLSFSQARNVVLVSAQTPLFPALSVAQNISLVATHNQCEQEQQSVVSLCECETLLTKNTASLSGGELQRVKLARALLASPKLLLLDESFSAMDKALRQRILYRLKAYLGEQVRVILVSHDVDDILQTCENLAQINGGQCLAVGRPEALINAEADTDTLPLSCVIYAAVQAVDPAAGLMALSLGKQLIQVKLQPGVSPGTKAKVRLSAKEITLATADAEVVKTNRLACQIIQVETVNHRQYRVALSCGEQKLVALVSQEVFTRSDLKVGGPVYACFDE
ncbi:ATP-binding cassette domain-containing protein [Alteromonas lipolytica]|uniref:ABC transporter domain-containing protein n=1 Tax=Alteromonas lipolytica TaxID=1856405 RepID=A0A1E8FG20_9ALTE|nr:ATP-binding cassette domain-containing protein [Alteromonas lipolytica]OFI34892.1 hypothetical protein BFC17_15090 [Alteromonas lipolytica]GGF54889.1 ABC transporter ATPase [Alteromonas lipolytica]